jgi:hypothetical protein
MGPIRLWDPFDYWTSLTMGPIGLWGPFDYGTSLTMGPVRLWDYEPIKVLPDKCKYSANLKYFQLNCKYALIQVLPDKYKYFTKMQEIS